MRVAWVLLVLLAFPCVSAATYFIETARVSGNGTPGVNGSDGVGINASVVLANGSLQFTYSNGTIAILGNVTGARGEQGATGATGATGAKGDPGVNGTNGINGTNASVTGAFPYVNVTNGVVGVNLSAFNLLYYPLASNPLGYYNSSSLPLQNSTAWNRTGTNVILANTNDNVGIGTTNPSRKLTVNVGGSQDGLDVDGTGNPEIRIGDVSGTNKVTMAYESSDVSLRVGTTGHIDTLYVGGGNLGVGTGAFISDSDGLAETFAEVKDADDVRLVLDYGGASSEFAEVLMQANNKNQVGLRSTPSYFHVYNYPRAKSDLVIMNSTGYVGIGTTNPVEELHVNASSNPAILFTNDASGYTSSDGFFFGMDNGADYLWGYENKPLIIATNNNERARITGSGNVGIGTTSPTTFLDVTMGSGVTPAINIKGSSSGSFTNRSSISFNYNGGGGGFILGANKASNSQDFFLYDVHDSAYRLFVDTNGKVGIGTTSPSATLDVAGTLEVNTLGSASATHLCINASNVLSTCSSSIRYKENVRLVNADVRDAVNDLRVVTFDWKGGNITGRWENTTDGEGNSSLVWVPSVSNDHARKHVGLIAEDVASVAQTYTNGNVVLTFKNSNGQIEGIDYEALTAVLVKNIQDLNAENEQLKRAVVKLCQAAPGVCA